MYATQVGEQHFVFGSSGLLYRSNKLMYDRQTNSLWHSLTGEPVTGRLAHSGIKLTMLPVVVSTWGQWKKTHPTTTVLSLSTGHQRRYTPGAAYGPYYASPATMFPVWQRSQLLPTKALIYALTLHHTPKAYPLTILEQERITHDTLAGVDVVLISEAQGRTVRAYQRAGHRFTHGPDPRTLLDETAHLWLLTETALEKTGTADKLLRIPGHIAYWFGWFAFHPHTLVYGHPAPPPP